MKKAFYDSPTRINANGSRRKPALIYIIKDNGDGTSYVEFHHSCEQWNVKNKWIKAYNPSTSWE